MKLQAKSLQGGPLNTSLFELFKIGIGPSSSHTVGPMRAALRFAAELPEHGIERLQVDLYGSLAHTGIGHGTDRAILLGLSGEKPDTVDPAAIEGMLALIRENRAIVVKGQRVPFVEATNLLFHRGRMYPDGALAENSHPNGMRFTAFSAGDVIVVQEIFYSVGGGFILSAAELQPDLGEKLISPRTVPFPFRSAEQLLRVAKESQFTIAELILANECALYVADCRSASNPIQRPGISLDMGADAVKQIHTSILALWSAMKQSTERGIRTHGVLPGGLNVRRRAPRLHERIQALDDSGKPRDPLAPLDWVSLFAIAVNEENAAGGRVVTAPTNGAAGVIPAIAHYYIRFIDTDLSTEQKQAGLLRYFLTAAAIGILYKENASISGAEVGCQGEVGVACSMAAGGLVAAVGGSNEQIEHAAEIAMEHNLGMTCDPIGGLVQIPCIERNAMGAVKAVNACRMAMHETEGHKLSLDQVIETMYRTGMDMQSRYKETSQAGLALNIIEC